ncbi:hypothetical protein CRENBAI_011340 [Crenichthys baileyi]|uniref:Uncharacterized protein n=1 Tax=Crenichthys baileyi TaxID=28760 RepID=A0AAV9S0Q8_9TELE
MEKLRLLQRILSSSNPSLFPGLKLNIRDSRTRLPGHQNSNIFHANIPGFSRLRVHMWRSEPDTSLMVSGTCSALYVALRNLAALELWFHTRPSSEVLIQSDSFL